MQIFIPESERAHLAVLLKAKAELLDAIYTALERAAPSLGLHNLVAWLATELKNQGGAKEQTLESIIRSLANLYQFRVEDSMAPDEVAEALIEGARASADKRLQEAEGGWDDFRKRLAKFLSLDNTFGVTARAGFVASQTPRHFHEARVLTDARPIYSHDAGRGPTAFVVLHSLQIDYYEDGQNRTWFVALDGDDLETLRLAVDRAQSKERSLRKVLEKTEIPTLVWQDRADASD